MARAVSEVERHEWEMRRLAVESGSGKGVMFASDKAILAAVSAISLPRIPVWEGTHWKASSQPSAERWMRIRWVAWTRAVEEDG